MHIGYAATLREGRAKFRALYSMLFLAYSEEEYLESKSISVKDLRELLRYVEHLEQQALNIAKDEE